MGFKNLYDKDKIYNILDIIKHNFWKLINFIIKKVNSINIILKFLLLKITSKKFNKKILYLITLTNFKFKILIK